MIDYETFHRIKYLHEKLGLKPTQIGEHVGCSRKTVVKWLQEEMFRPTTRGVRKRSVCAPFRAHILAGFKKGLPLTEIHSRLTEDHGYSGSYSSLKDFVRTELPGVPRGSDSASVWMLAVIQGKTSIDELEEKLAGGLQQEDIHSLREVVLTRPLKYRNRAMTILATKAGIPLRCVCECLSISRKTAKKYIHDFEGGGVEKLMPSRAGSTKDKKRRNPEYIDAVFSILHTPPSCYDINRTSWRLPDLCCIMAQEGFPVDRHTVGQIIRDAGYRTCKAKKVLTSNDPEYRKKLKNITAILSNLGPDERFFSVDEFGPFAVKMQGGRSLMPPGEIRTVPQWQKSKGSLILTGALELSTNQMTHFYSDNKNTEEMIKLLEVLLDQYRDQECIYLSWDAASWHASGRIYEKVEEVNSEEYQREHGSPLVRLAPLPSRAQFLNVIESVFSGMARAIIHNSDYESVGACKTAIDRHFAERNQYFRVNPQRAGKKIWGKERVKPAFRESNNCKDPNW